MKITYIRPGTGGAFYCENCVRDHSLITGLRALGHDVTPVAMYLPVEEIDDTDGFKTPVIFGAVQLYLIDKYPYLKKYPQNFLRLLDRRPILNLAATFAASTRAAGHEEMTISMIMGEEGKFADEFDIAVNFLLEQKPDAIIIPNAFLIGFASAVKAKSPRTKVICMLQDEHVWVDVFAQKYQNKTWEVIARKTRSADMLCAHSDWYRQKIAAHLNISPDKISVIPFGVDANKYIRSSLPTTSSTTSASATSTTPISIGYISRLCDDHGLDTLTDAYCQLLNNGVLGANTSLKLCGGYTKDDSAVIKSSRKKIARANGRLHIEKLFDVNTRGKFLSSTTLLSVPTKTPIALGGFIIEAMAAGVPVAQPDIGGFSEIINETNAGIVYSPNTSDALAAALEKIIRDTTARRAMSEAGIKAVAQKYNHIEMARQVVAGVLRGG